MAPPLTFGPLSFMCAQFEKIGNGLVGQTTQILTTQSAILSEAVAVTASLAGGMVGPFGNLTLYAFSRVWVRNPPLPPGPNPEVTQSGRRPTSPMGAPTHVPPIGGQWVYQITGTWRPGDAPLPVAAGGFFEVSVTASTPPNGNNGLPYNNGNNRFTASVVVEGPNLPTTEISLVLNVVNIDTSSPSSPSVGWMSAGGQLGTHGDFEAAGQGFLNMAWQFQPSLLPDPSDFPTPIDCILGPGGPGLLVPAPAYAGQFPVNKQGAGILFMPEGALVCELQSDGTFTNSIPTAEVGTFGPVQVISSVYSPSGVGQFRVMQSFFNGAITGLSTGLNYSMTALQLLPQGPGSSA